MVSFIKRFYIRTIKWLFVLFWVFIFFLSALLAYWYIRPNTAYINDDLDMNTWQAYDDPDHDSNTNLVYWKDDFYLVHQTSNVHWASSESAIIVRKSSNAKDFKKVAEIDYPDEDIRDPKFAAINDTLFIYALPNKINVIPVNSPYKTVYSKSTDGKKWSEFKDIEGDAKEKWKLWRPKTRDNMTWYVTAHGLGEVVLLKSKDGIEWNKVSTVYDKDYCSESAMEFLPNGDIVVTSRCEYSIGITGDPGAYTMLSTAKAPYKEWAQKKSYITKLDGPAIFLNPVDNKTYAVGRYEPEAKGLFTNTGSFFNKKRTSIFLLENNELTYLSDLPSGGDTSYLGAVIRRDLGYVYLSYYTSDIEKDYIWFEGQITISYVRIAKIKLSSLAKVADNPPELYQEGFAFDNIYLVIGYMCIIAAVIYCKVRKNRGV